MDRQVGDGSQGTQIGLLPDPLLGIVGPCVDVGREIADAVDLIPRPGKDAWQNVARSSQRCGVPLRQP
jgi:hypothetical protein